MPSRSPNSKILTVVLENWKKSAAPNLLDFINLSTIFCPWLPEKKHIFILRFSNFEPSFKLRWYCPQDLFGSQIQSNCTKLAYESRESKLAYEACESLAYEIVV